MTINGQKKKINYQKFKAIYYKNVKNQLKKIVKKEKNYDVNKIPFIPLPQGKEV